MIAKVCATCGLPVRYDVGTGEYYHIVGDDPVSKILETVARTVTDAIRL